MAQDKKSSDEILKELFNSIHDIVPSSDDDAGSDVEKKVVVKKEKKSKSSYDSSYCSKSKHKKKKKSKKSSTKYSLHISSSDKKSKDKKSSSKSTSDSGSRKEKSRIKVEKELDLIEVLKKEVIESVPCTVIPEPESIALPPLNPAGNVFIKQEPASPKKPTDKDDGVFKEPGKPVSNNEVVDPKLGETSSDDGPKESCGEETISKVADVFEEYLLDSGDKLHSKGLVISEKPKKTILIQNLKNSSVLEDAAKSKAKSEELKMKKKKKQEEGELTDDLSDISSSSDSELDSTDEDAEPSKTNLKLPEDSRLSEDRMKKGRRKEEKDKSKKKKKKEKHRHKDRTGEDGSRRRSEHKSKRSDKDERSSRRRSRSRSRINAAQSSRRSLSHHTDISRHKERRWGSRSRSRSLDRGRKRSQSPHSKKRRTSRELEDLRSKLKRRKSSERERSGDRRSRNKGSPERSRPRQEKDEYYIDKGKLLEIARKNALSMLRQGQVGGVVNKVVHITAGGKTVDELTDFCKHLSRKEASGMESVSSDSSSDESEKPFHHPFKLKERPSQIIMNIRNCVPLPPKTHQEKATETLRIQFPVSSGQHHRKTESEWVPVSPKKTETKTQPTTTKPKETTAPLAIEAPPVVAGPVAPKYPTVYPTPAEKRAIDIGAVISERLAAIRKDYDSSSSPVFGTTRSWETPHTTGLFTGSTGAKVLTPTELASGQQAWARKSDQRVRPPEPTPSLLENGCTPEMLALKISQMPLALPSGSSREALNKRYGFSTELPDLPTGQLVCITDLKVKGNIVKKLEGSRSYLIETKEGRKVVSDRFHLVPL